MTKRNEQMQRMAEQYWRKLESGGMAHELAPQTLVVGSFRDGLKSGLAAHRAEILKLERENAALREDKARLDWLDAANQALNEAHGTKYGWKYDANHNRCQIALNDCNIPALSIRQAIDAARKEAQP